jgi:hypothetical protein
MGMAEEEKEKKWDSESAEKDTKALDRLFYEVGAYRKSKEFRELFDFIRKFPKVAPYNALLLHIQKPGCRYVLSASHWQKRYGRTIKPGARPLVILVPFGPVGFVFELGDTEGNRSFPERLLNPFKTEGEISKHTFDTLLNNLPCDGVRYVEADLGTNAAGSIQYIPGGAGSQPCRNKTVKVLFVMQVNRNHSREEKFATIVHELAHLYCGHVGSMYPGWWPDRRYKRALLNEIEFEAESVVWLVCERLYLKNPSAKYLSVYLNKYDEIPPISMECVLKAAGRIESMTAKNLSPRKEIVR